MNLQLFTKWYAKYLIFGLCCLILLIIPLLRGPLIGTDVFLFSRLAENPSFYDSLSYGGRYAIYEWGTPLILSIIPTLIIEILPFLLGILSFLVFRKILKEFFEDEKNVNICLLLMILSPTFIYLFSFTNQYFLGIFLSLVTFYFLTTKKLKWISLVTIALTPMFNLIIGILLMILSLGYIIFKRKDNKKIIWSIGTISIIYLGIFLYLIFSFDSNIGLKFVSQSSFVFLKGIFYDLGNSLGLGIFLTILAFIGIIANWGKKYYDLFVFFSIFGLIILSLFFTEALIVLSFFLIIFAGLGIIILMDFKWTDLQYKRYIMFIILSGLVFSSISQLTNISEYEPKQNITKGLQFLSGVKPGVVFTDYSRGVWINYANQENIIDENYLFAPEAQERLDDMNKIYFSRDADEIEQIFDKYSIDYIWIDSEMKNNIWNYDSEGLLFVLYYTKTFNLIYNKDGVEIWEVKND